jgi:hypothetical protein
MTLMPMRVSSKSLWTIMIFAKTVVSSRVPRFMTKSTCLIVTSVKTVLPLPTRFRPRRFRIAFFRIVSGLSYSRDSVLSPTRIASALQLRTRLWRTCSLNDHHGRPWTLVVNARRPIGALRTVAVIGAGQSAQKRGQVGVGGIINVTGGAG